MSENHEDVDLNNHLSLRVTRALLLLVVFFLAMHVCFKLAEYLQPADGMTYRVLRRLFDLDGENTITAWFSSFLLSTSALLLYLIGYLKHNSHSKYWYILSIAFFYLSIDESLSFHEKASRAIRRIFEANEFSIPFLYNIYWVLPAGALSLILFLYLLPFLRATHQKIRNVFIAAGVVYVTGAVGLEVAGGFIANNFQYVFYELIFPFEELFEMVGVIIFLHALTSVLVLEVRRV
ncbi:hypothetical protein N8881_08540 [Pseudomonadales bacterium]|nr:hypothetical protein [Pseudomonadales bacterium]